MNFFRAQDDARRKTWLLCALMAVALAILIVGTAWLVNTVFLIGALTQDGGYGLTTPTMLSHRNYLAINPKSFAISSVIVIVAVGLACGYKFLQVKNGGRAIAESLNGRLISPDSRDRDERQLLNVVEEMSIASSVPVPPIYVLEENAINAFAAGYGVDDAVIGVTRGTIELLTRDELQGVIAHEFSHILNGDTRLNLRLVVMLFGIVFLGMMGRRMLRQRSFQALGLGLIVLGFIGTVLGGIIKAAVSRQREFLADAAAVQFTRNPDGIANALKKIGTASGRAMLPATPAGEHSHMFFGQAVRVKFNSLMATHPPLAARIKAINPYWNGRFSAPDGTRREAPQKPGIASFATPAGSFIKDTTVIEQIGRPNWTSLETANFIIRTIDPTCIEASHEPWGASALILAMLINGDANHRIKQLESVAEFNDTAMQSEVLRLHRKVNKSDKVHKLALLELCSASLKQMSRRQHATLMKTAIGMVKADGVVSLFEWVLLRLLEKEIGSHFTRRGKKFAAAGTAKSVNAHAASLLRYLAHYGHSDPEQRVAAYSVGCAELGVSSQFTPVTQSDFRPLNAAINHLRQLKPLEKPRVLKACAKTVLYDNIVSDAQTALLQAFAAALDCPLPPTVVPKLNQRGSALKSQSNVA